MAGRSGFVIPARMLIVPPEWSRLLELLIEDAAPRHFRTNGLTMPAAFASWLRDLSDVAAANPPVERPTPSAWLDVDTAAALLALSPRRVRQMRAAGVFRSRLEGERRWMLAAEDVAEELEARQFSSGSDRKRIGSRSGNDPPESDTDLTTPHLEAS